MNGQTYTFSLTSIHMHANAAIGKATTAFQTLICEFESREDV